MKNSSIMRSKLLRRGLLPIFFVIWVAVLLSLSGSRVSSQSSEPTQPPQARNEEIKPVSRLVDDAKRAGRDFQIVEPFNPQTRSVAADVARRRAVTAGSILQLRPNALAELVNRNAPSLTLLLPAFAGPPIELELVQVNPFAQGFNVVTSGSNGQPVAYEHGVHYWGVIKGIEGSRAAISVFKDEVIGTYSSPAEGNFVLGKLAGNNPARDHILYAEKDLTSTLSASCDTPDDNAAFSPQELDSSSSAAVTRCVKIYIEADVDLFQNRGTVSATVNFVTGVFNQSAALFNNEGIPISISQIFVWTTPSPYNGGSSNVQLSQFQSFRTSFNGDIAHLVDLQSNQGGIAAGFNGFCNPNRSQSQCYSGIDPFFNNVPTYSWTVEVFTHEMGHLFGSRHTHACVWNGNNTAIDGCGHQAGFFEGSCGFGPIPSDGGTVMSYCHLNSVGINFSKGFGPQPGNVIRNRFNSASCLGTCGEPASASIAWIQPAETSWGPANTMTVAGYAQNGTGGVQLVWRDVTINGPWNVVSWQPPPSTDHTWSNTIPSPYRCHTFQAYVNYSGVQSPIFTYNGVSSAYCNESARVIWIQPQSSAGFGPPGSLVIAGSAKNAPSGTQVFLWHRNVSLGTGWRRLDFAALPGSDGVWYNAIENANPFHQYQVYVTYDVITSSPCTYSGSNSITWCP